MRIAAFGLGRLGLVWALAADAAGHEVRGVDVRDDVIDAVNRREARTPEPGVTELLAAPGCRLRATPDAPDALRNCDVSVVMVATPSRDDGSFSPAVVVEVVSTIGQHVGSLADPHVVVVVSTVSPGTIDGPVRHALEAASGRALDDSLGLVYVPEFHAIGAVLDGLRHPRPFFVGSHQPWAADIAERLFSSLAVAPAPPARHLSAIDTEIAKLGVNAYLTTKIAFANALDDLCSDIPGSDALAVCAALGDDPRIGRSFLRPGFPYGGPCLPRDVPAWRRASLDAGTGTALVDGVDEANRHRYDTLFEAVIAAAAAKPERAGRVGLTGLAFKAGTAVDDGSPAVELARRCRAVGLEVVAHEPLVDPAVLPEVPRVPTLVDLLATSDVLVLTTPDADVANRIAAALTTCTSPPVVIDPWRALAHRGSSR